jgi:hypothetical protein
MLFKPTVAAENDTTVALEGIKKLQLRLTSRSPAASILSLHVLTTQCTNLKADLMSYIKILKSQNGIFGSLPTIEELISPPEE